MIDGLEGIVSRHIVFRGRSFRLWTVVVIVRLVVLDRRLMVVEVVGLMVCRW